MAADAAAVAASVIAGLLLAITFRARVAGEYPLFPFFLAALPAIGLGSVRAGLGALVAGFVVALAWFWPVAELPARLAEGTNELRIAIYWLGGLVFLGVVRAMRLARARAAELAHEALATADEVERWRALADTVLDSAPVGIGFFDKTFRVLRQNRALAAMPPATAGPRTGGGIEAAPELRQAFEHVVRSGDAVVGLELERRAADDAGARYWRASVYPVRAQGDPVFAVAAVVEEVTDRREVLRQLRESEERYRSLVAATTAIVSVADADGRFVVPQDSWEAYTGQPWPEHREYGYAAAIHPADRDAAWAAWTAARAEGRVFDYSARLFHAASGGFRHCTARVVPVRNPDGTIREWVSSLSDIHEVVLAQTAIRRSEARFREMANLIPQVIWTADAEGRLDYYNQQWLDFVGMSLEEALERGWRGVVHPDDLDRVERAWAAARRRSAPIEIEFRQRGHDGAYRWYLCRAVPVLDEHGSVLRWLGTSTDIDEKTRAAEALRLERDLVDTLNRVGRALSAELDSGKLLEAIAEAGTRLVGARLGAFVPAAGAAQEDAPVVAVDGAPAAEIAVLRARPWFAEVLRERRVLRTDGAAGDGDREMAGGSLLAAPVVSRTAEVFGALVFTHPDRGVFDERDERLVVGVAAQAAIAIENARLYAAERHARGEAEAASRAKDEFLSMLSHELRTPLTAMLSWLRLLREGRVRTERVTQALETVERSGWTLARIVDDLLDVSRIVTGLTRLDFQPVELRGVLEAARATIRPTAESKHVTLDLDLEPGGAIVAGDPGRLQQIVWNLLANAVRFTPAGGRVELALERHPGEAHIVVRDSGAGIAADFLPHVFERFRQGEPGSQRQHGGLGLGLAIVRHLVELHGGEVRAASPGEGQGATFTVTLPLAFEAYQASATGRSA